MSKSILLIPRPRKLEMSKILNNPDLQETPSQDDRHPKEGFHRKQEEPIIVADSKIKI